MQVLSVASVDYTGLHRPRKGRVKEYLVNFFRMFTLHLIYFSSRNAATLVQKLANGSRDVCDQIVKDPPEEGIAGDFRFFLSFACLPEPEKGHRYITSEYFNVLRAFCTHGEQAVVRVQNMVARTLKGQEDLVGQRTGPVAFEVGLLLPFELEREGQRVRMQTEKSRRTTSKSTERIMIGLKKESPWQRLTDRSGLPYYKNKETDEVELRAGEFEKEGGEFEDEFEFSTEGLEQAKREAKVCVDKILIRLELKTTNNGNDATEEITMDFATPDGHQPRQEWNTDYSTTILSEICEPINEERAVTKNVYFEPTLKDDMRFFLLEAQMNLGSEISKGDNEQSRVLVGNHYSKDVLMKIFKDDELAYGLRTAALKIFHNVHLNIGGIVPDGHRPQYIYRWDAPEERANIGEDIYMESANQIHEWLVAATVPQTKEQKREARDVKALMKETRKSSAKDPKPQHAVRVFSFKADLEQFMEEMENIVISKRPWNGMNSSKRVPFHERQAHFILTTLKVAKFLTLVRFYSAKENQGKGLQLLDVLRSCVLKHATSASKNRRSNSEDVTRNDLIDRVLTLTLELVELLTYIRIERDAVEFFVTDYRFIYAQAFELQAQKLPESHKHPTLLNIIPKQCTEANALTWDAKTNHQVLHLTHPNKNVKPITE